MPLTNLCFLRPTPKITRLRDVAAAEEAWVEKGAPLAIFEAMKSEHTITAPAAGVVEVVWFGGR